MLLTAIRMQIGTRQMRRNAFLELVMPASYLAAKDRRQLSAELAPLFGRDLANQPAVVMKQVRAMSRYDAAPRFAELAHVPTLVISATEDRIARPACGRALASAIPGARFVEIAGAAHGVTIQKADEINALLAEHWERSERTPAPGHPPTSRWQDLPS
jgi:3-oxoadipate enol-lactonase